MLRFFYSGRFSLFCLSALLLCILFPIAKAPANIALVILTVLAILGAVFWKHPVPDLLKNSTDISGILLLSMPLLWYVHPGPGPYGAYAKDALFALYMFAMMYWARQYPYYIDQAIKLVVLSTGLVAVASILQYFHIIPMRSHGQPTGLYSGLMHGALSLLLAFSCTLLSYLCRHEQRQFYRYAYFVIMLICVTDLILVVSARTGYIALIAVSGFILFNLYKINKLLLPGIILALSLLALSSDGLWKRIEAGRSDMTQYSSGIADTSLGSRFEMWKVSWKNFVENPVFGAGTNGFFKRWVDEGSQKVTQKLNNAHSTYFHILGNYGLAGFGILLFFLWRLSLTAWKNCDSLAGVAVGYFVVVFIVGSLTNTMVTGDFYLTWLAIIGGVAGGGLEQKQNMREAQL